MNIIDILEMDKIAARFAATAADNRISFVAHLLGKLAQVDAEAVAEAMQRATVVRVEHKGGVS
jgi:hydroxyethylthiazole kinase-like sugar kinase family protein